MSSNNQNLKNLSFAEKLKLFQNGNNQQDSMKNEQKNINKNDLNSQQKIKIQNDIKQQDQSIENPPKNISAQKNQSMNSFQDKMKIFQNDKISNSSNSLYEKTVENDKDKLQNQLQNNNKATSNENAFKDKMKIFQTDNKGILINKNDQKTIDSNQNESIEKSQSSNSFQDKMKIFQNDKSSNSSNSLYEKTVKNDNDKLQNQQQNINKENEDESDKKDLKSSAFKDKMKVFQTDKKDILINKNDQKNINSMENESKKCELITKNQSSSSFQDKMKIFQIENISSSLNISHEDKDKLQNQQQNINKDTTNENDKKDQISSAFKDKMKIFQADNKEKSINKEEQIIISPNDKLNESKSFEKNQSSGSFKDKMKIFQNDTDDMHLFKKEQDNNEVKLSQNKNNEEYKSFPNDQTSSSIKDRMKIFQNHSNESQHPINKQLIEKPIKLSEENNIHYFNKEDDNISIQKKQISNSFQDRMKVFQKDPNATPQSKEEQINSKFKDQKANEIQKNQEISNSIRDRIKSFQNEANNNQQPTKIPIFKQENELQNKELKEKENNEGINKNENNKPLTSTQTSNSFKDRMKIFQNNSKDTSQANIEKERKESTNVKNQVNAQINEKRFSILEKAQFVASNFHLGKNIPTKTENIDTNISRGPNFDNAKNISKGIRINLSNEEKVIKKIKNITKNIMESTTIFDQKYCLVLKNSFILFLKSVILEILKKDNTLSNSILLPKVYLIKTVEMQEQMEKISLFIENVYIEKMHQIDDVKGNEEEDMKDQNEIDAKSMNYVMSEKETYNEISLQITCEADLNSKIPQDF